MYQLEAPCRSLLIEGLLHPLEQLGGGAGEEGGGGVDR